MLKSVDCHPTWACLWHRRGAGWAGTTPPRCAPPAPCRPARGPARRGSWGSWPAAPHSCRPAPACHVSRGPSHIIVTNRRAVEPSCYWVYGGGGGRGGGRLACLESPLLPSFLPSAAVGSIISFQVAPGSCHCCIENCSQFTKFLWIPPS